MDENEGLLSQLANQPMTGIPAGAIREMTPEEMRDRRESMRRQFDLLRAAPDPNVAAGIDRMADELREMEDRRFMEHMGITPPGTGDINFPTGQRRTVTLDRGDEEIIARGLERWRNDPGYIIQGPITSIRLGRGPQGPVVEIDTDGFRFHGRHVNDHGAAYHAFMSAMHEIERRPAPTFSARWEKDNCIAEEFGYEGFDGR